jgi:hypothetical protein
VGVTIRNDHIGNNTLPALWDAGSSTSQPIITGTVAWNTANGYATAINGSGMISGYYTDFNNGGSMSGLRHAWLKMPDGTLHNDLFDLSVESWATGLNDDNVVVGGWLNPTRSSGTPSAWIGTDQSNIFDLPNNDLGVPSAINKRGVIVGGAGAALIWYPLKYEPAGNHFRYRAPLLLQSLVAAPGVTLTTALCINDKGQILCQGLEQSSSTLKMYLLTPVPSRFVIP